VLNSILTPLINDGTAEAIAEATSNKLSNLLDGFDYELNLKIDKESFR
jgi:hypothetical protein